MTNYTVYDPADNNIFNQQRSLLVDCQLSPSIYNLKFQSWLYRYIVTLSVIHS